MPNEARPAGIVSAGATERNGPVPAVGQRLSASTQVESPLLGLQLCARACPALMTSDAEASPAATSERHRREVKASRESVCGRESIARCSTPAAGGLESSFVPSGETRPGWRSYGALARGDAPTYVVAAA